MAGQDIRLPDGVTAHFVNRLDGGLDVSDDPDDLDASKAAELSNVRFQQGQVRSDTGYDTFLGVVIGAPRKVYRFVLANQSVEYLLVTNAVLYRRLSSEWQYISDGVATTTTAIEPAAETTIAVVDSTGITATDRVGITLDDGTQHKTTVASVPGGTSIIIDDGIPAGRQADSGAAVVKSAEFSGNDARQISIVTDPSNDWVLFTNGVDVVQKYDPTAGGTVTALGGLSTVNVDTCRTLKIFNSILFLGFTVESAANKPQRVRNSDIGAYETWNSGLAGFEDFFDEEDDIKRLELLGPFLIAYRSNSIRRGEFTFDDSDIVNWSTMVPDKGVVSHDAVIPVGARHICIDETDIYEYFGGFEATSISGALFDKLFGASSEISPANFDRVFGIHLKGLREVFIFWPDTNDIFPTRVARLDLVRDRWSLRDFGEEFSGWGVFEETTSKAWSELVGDWASQSFTWSSSIVQASAPTLLLCGDVALQVYEYDFFTTDDNSTAIAWMWCSKNFMSAEQDMRLDSFSIFAKGGSLTIEYSTDKGGTFINYATIALTGSLLKFEVYKQFVSRQVMWRFSGSGSGFAIDWFSFTFLVEGESR